MFFIMRKKIKLYLFIHINFAISALLKSKFMRVENPQPPLTFVTMVRPLFMKKKRLPCLSNLCDDKSKLLL